MNQTKIWAHRGASGYAPENTMEAFELALEMGADGIELDVQLSRDGQLVVAHDETIDRVSNGTGYLKNYDYQELSSFQFNKTKPEFKNAKIPKLEEVYDLVKGKNIELNVELKTGVFFYDGIEQKVWDLTKKMGLQEQVIFSSFNHYSVQKMKSFSKKARTGFLYRDGLMNMPNYALNHEAEALHPHVSLLQYPGFVQECRRKGVKLHVWTVNQEWQMKQCAKMGIDSIITNYPDKAKAAMR